MINDDAELLYAELPQSGDYIGNIALQKKLGWDKVRFFAARNTILNAGAAERSTGQGGRTRRKLPGPIFGRFGRVRQMRSAATTTPSVLATSDSAANEELAECKLTNSDPELHEKLVVIDPAVTEALAISELLTSERAASELTAGETATNDLISTTTAPPLATVTNPRESALYPPIEAVLNSAWSADEGLTDFVVHDTSTQGSRRTGGKWSRPDLTCISIRRYEFVPGHVFDVYSFEVKKFTDLDVSAVHEALAHARFASMPYLISDYPSSPSDDDEALIDTVKAHAMRHGIGFITASNVGDYNTWTHHCEPTRHSPDFFQLNQFISAQIPEEKKSKISSWVQSIK